MRTRVLGVYQVRLLLIDHGSGRLDPNFTELVTESAEGVLGTLTAVPFTERVASRKSLYVMKNWYGSSLSNIGRAVFETISQYHVHQSQ